MKGLKRQDTNLNNSIGPNILTDDKTALNYLALAWCITGYNDNGTIKNITSDKALRAYRLYENKDNEKKKSTKKITLKNEEFLIENVKTGEVIKIIGGENVEKEIGIKAEYISAYSKHKMKYKKTYLIHRPNPSDSLRRKIIILKNTVTGETKEFRGFKDVAKFLKVGESSIRYYKRINKIINGWKVESIN